MSNWFTRAPVDVPENAQKPETVLLDHRGKPLVVRQPRSIGFRPPTPVAVEVEVLGDIPLPATDCVKEGC